MEKLRTGVEKETAERLLELQKRCVNCGSVYALHIHHRVFRSEGEVGLQAFLSKVLPIYRKCYKREIEPWHLHDIQQLVVLCNRCHEAPNVGVHGGNIKLRDYLRHSFTCSKTGFNIPFYKPKSYGQVPIPR